MHIGDLFDVELFRANLAEGYIRASHHPELPLAVYCYTPKAVVEQKWDEVTRRCRGLVVSEASDEIVALPFPKFFNSNQHHKGNLWAGELPQGQLFRVFTKMDGSLIVVFEYEGQWHACTKGSFNIFQAKWAQDIVRGGSQSLEPGVTYLAELIHPENRIVVDYGDRIELVLLGGFDVRNGWEMSLTKLEDDWSQVGPVVKSWGATDKVERIEALAKANKLPDGTQTTGVADEGFVLRYANGLRVKVKMTEYLALHKSLTGVSERNIWSALRTGAPIESLYEKVPDEFLDWVKSVVAKFRAQHAELVSEVVDEFDQVRDAYGELDRKEFAAKVAGYRYKGVLFALYDGNGDKINEWAWKQIRPEGRTGTFALAAGHTNKD